MPKMQFDFPGLSTLLAKNLYREKRVFIRELVQNAHDSNMRRKDAAKDEFAPRIDLESRPDQLKLVVRDNGLGMNRHDIEEYLSVIGRSGTQIEKGEATGVIGQFGIGFLSAFVVADRVEVRTRKLGEEQGWVWVNTGSQEYSLEPAEVARPGTTVIVTLKGHQEKGVIAPEEIERVIRKYADMLRVPIHLNSSREPINRMIMPWERRGLNAEELQLEMNLYIVQTMPDSPLTLVPINLSEPDQTRANGILYITNQRSLPNPEQPPGIVRVFQQRMYLCETRDMLPPWATFVNGVLESPDLCPTAARDNFVTDEASESLKRRLGEVLVEHLQKLAEDDSERLDRILHFHGLRIKAACSLHDELFSSIAMLLRWRTNSRKSVDEQGDGQPVWRTLPEILEQLPETAGRPRHLPCFGTPYSANQYFSMAESAGTLVIDASGPFEIEILKKYAQLPEFDLEIVRVDQVDDPNVFRHVAGDQGKRLQRLADRMMQIIKPKGRGIKVEGRRFEPNALAAVIRTTEPSRSQQKAEELANQPNAPDDLREMAEALLRYSKAESTRLTINAANPLIQELVQHPETFANPEVMEIMLGIYNNAILYNHDLLTTENTQILNHQFQNLLEKRWNSIQQEAGLLRREQNLQKRERQLSPLAGETRSAYRRFFMITPYEDTLEPLIAAVRTVIEDHWECQLQLARDWRHEDRGLDNIRKHIQESDGFIVELTTTKANVMFELGAIRFDQRSRPIVYLRDGEAAREDIPFDLLGHLCVLYDQRGEEEIVDFLDREMRKGTGIAAILDDRNREKFISKRRLRDYFAPLSFEESVVEKLAREFPSAESWRSAKPEAIAPLLGEYAQYADNLIQNVRAGLGLNQASN